MKRKIIVRGPALSRSGYGEQTRFALRALRSHEDEWDIHLSNTGWGQTGCIWEDHEEHRWLNHLIIKTKNYIGANKDSQEMLFDMSLQVTIPNEWENMAKINVGYTAGIETTKIAPVWIEKSRLMDKIIVVSKHAKFGFDSTTYDAKDNKTGQVIKDYRNETPIEVVNYAVRDTKPTPLALNLETDTNFLVVAQWSVRKNIENTIRWFVEEFHEDSDVGLVLKLSSKSSCKIDKHLTEKRLENLLSSYKNRKCKIYLIHGDMLEEEMFGLYTHPKIKALISLAHGEGYGLPIFEAAYNELPVIAPGWGGQCDFLYAPDKKKKGKNKPYFLHVEYEIAKIQPEAVWNGVLQADSYWCYAKEHSYKKMISKFRKNQGVYKKNAKILADHIKKNFKEENIYDHFIAAMVPSSVIEPQNISFDSETPAPYEEVFVV